MNDTTLRLTLVAAGYLIGGIPFGLVIARAKGVDILKVGSGNIGATNVGRVLGKPFFYICFACDALKGLLPTLGFGLIASIADPAQRTSSDLWWWLTAMLAPVLGHMFSPYLRFKGGKGVATGLGSMLAVVPVLTVPAVIGLATYIAMVKITRYVGVSSCAAALSLPVSVSALALAGVPAWQDAWPAVAVTGLLAAVVVAKHRGNLARTLAGTEPRAGQPIEPPPDQASDTRDAPPRR
ncbi:MAG: glycerol-3-phosphate 1-O-acyltransferase PlsY [Planctomycetota bacterium]